MWCHWCAAADARLMCMLRTALAECSVGWQVLLGVRRSGTLTHHEHTWKRASGSVVRCSGMLRIISSSTRPMLTTALMRVRAGPSPASPPGAAVTPLASFRATCITQGSVIAVCGELMLTINSHRDRDASTQTVHGRLCLC